MTKLSPAAQAVFESFNSRFDWVEDGVPGPAIAAALHAAASQLLAVQWNGQIPVSATEQIGINWARDALHVLANELEALQSIPLITMTNAILLLEADRDEEPSETWDSHPSLTAEERNPTLK